MSNYAFLSEAISLKRILKGLAISISCTIMILYLGIYYIDLIDTSLREHYLGEQKFEVLGIEEKTNFEIEYASELEDITKGYGIDEYIYNWDGVVEGYHLQTNYIREPRFYFSGNTAEISESWRLRDGYKLELYCPAKLIAEVIPGDYYLCTVKYNGALVSDSVRHYISYPEEGKTVYSQVSMVVYSTSPYVDIQGQEFLIVGRYAGGSYDDISVFKLVGGKLVKISFLYEDKLEDDCMVSSPMSFKLLSGEDSNWKFVTHHRNPATGPVNVYRIWNLDEERFTLDRTVGDIVE